MTQEAKEKTLDYLPWIEKYRPRNIEEIAHQGHVVATLRKSLQSANLPHLLFYGPPGTGKTSTILALARQLYGPQMMKSRVLELNASDERGINVVRHKIKSFAQFTVGKHKNASSMNHNINTINKKNLLMKQNFDDDDDMKGKGANGGNGGNVEKENSNKNGDETYPCPPYKIIILDEADSMTRDAQTALRRTMEKYSNVTRFCLICNYVSRIIAPVASRCAKFRFESLTSESMASKLAEIAGHESLKVPKETINEIIEISNGDMRKSITLLQSASLMRPKNETISIEDVLTVSVRVPKKLVKNRIIKACRSKSFQDINDCCEFIVAEGYPVSLVLAEILTFMLDDDNCTDTNNSNNNNSSSSSSSNTGQEELFTNLQKAKIALKIGQADKKLVDGASEFLQLLDVLGCIGQNIKKA